MDRGSGKKKGEREECAEIGMGMKAECSNTLLTFTAFQISQGRGDFPEICALTS